MATRRDLKDLRLEPFSKRFAKWLFDRRPDWLKHAIALEHSVEGFQVNTLAVNIPSQNPAVREPLTIDVDPAHILAIRWFQDPTSGGNLARRWEWDYVMYMEGMPEPLHLKLRDEPDFGFEVLLRDVEALLDERALAFWGSSSSGLRRLDEISPSGIESDNRWLVVRSWRGTHDRVVGI